MAYTSMEVYLGDYSIGDGKNVDYTRTNQTGKVPADINYFEIGKYKYDWEKYRNKFGKYITGEVNWDSLKDTEWLLYGSSCKIAPSFVGITTVNNVKTRTPLKNAKLLYWGPDSIIVTVFSKLVSITDTEALFNDYTPREILFDVINSLPNVVNNGVITGYTAKLINDPETISAENGDKVSVVIHDNIIYSNMTVGENISTREGGIDFDFTAGNVVTNDYYSLGGYGFFKANTGDIYPLDI